MAAAVTLPRRASPPRASTTTHAGIPLSRPTFHHLPTDLDTFQSHHNGHRTSTSISSRTSVERRSFDIRQVDMTIDTEKSHLAYFNSNNPYSPHPVSSPSHTLTSSPHSPYGRSNSHPHSPLRPASPATFPPRSRPDQPVAQLAVRAARDRLSCGSKSGALGKGLIIGWIITTLGFLAATAFWKGELFAALDRLSTELYDMGYKGLLVFGVLIFITTIPPLPLYSTLIVLSGYTFGVWNGFVASYIASLVGAVVVFVVSRTMLRDAVSRSLSSSPTAVSLLQTISEKPSILLMVRIAPYPYNLLNVVLASSPALSLQTYTACTAISLCKLVLHTWIGASMHDISTAYSEGSEKDSQSLKSAVTWGGVVLCIVIFVYLYLTHMAQRAIKKAEEQRPVAEEEVAFLSNHDLDDEE